MILGLCASYCRNENGVSVLLANIKEYLNITKKTAAKLRNYVFIKFHSQIIVMLHAGRRRLGSQ